MRGCGTASGRFGAPGPFRIHTLLLAYFDDGARIRNGDAAEKAGSLQEFKRVRPLERSREPDPLDPLTLWADR